MCESLTDSETMNLFAYGTLMNTEIMTEVSGARHRSRKATLQQYVRKTVQGQVYPAIINQSGSSVDGIVYFNVSPKAFARLDLFEGSLYDRIEAVAICDDGEYVDVFTYVITANAAGQLSDDDWNYENFMRYHKKLFQGAYQGYDELE